MFQGVVLRRKKVIEFTDQFNTAREAEEDAINIAKANTRGIPFTIKIFNIELDEPKQIGKTKHIQGERFNPAISDFESAVNLSEGFTTERSGRVNIPFKDLGVEPPDQDPRRLSKGMIGNARDDGKRS